MTLDQFYGGSGIDVLYPIQAMNTNPFSESEWNPSHLVCFLASRLLSQTRGSCI